MRWQGIIGRHPQGLVASDLSATTLKLNQLAAVIQPQPGADHAEDKGGHEIDQITGVPADPTANDSDHVSFPLW